MGIPERLVEIRERNGYTRKRLAEELNRPYPTITKYETGEREPGHAYIIEIAKKFNVTTDYILGIEKSPAPEKTGAGDERLGGSARKRKGSVNNLSLGTIAKALFLWNLVRI